MISITDRPRLYICLAFFGGILVTLGYKDVYPDLERRFLRRRHQLTNNLTALSGKPTVSLEDHTNTEAGKEQELDIPVGIESCIGNTPLFKIKSLSDATGCEILAKAEVWVLC